MCTALSADDIQKFFDRWIGRLPLPLTHTDRLTGFDYRLSILQMEVSRTHVFDDPVRGREFFEEVSATILIWDVPTAFACWWIAGPSQHTR